MSLLKALKKQSSKQNREFKVLLGLIDYYIKTGKPVGSNTLKEAGFGDLSSATIRNYFSHLEQEGYLVQQHASGGRIPTSAAYRAYAQENFESNELPQKAESVIQQLNNLETNEISLILQNSAESLSSLTNLAVFLSAPRFDHDFITNIKLIPIDPQRCVCIILTDFGVIRTEILSVDFKLSAFAAKRIEAYFHWRLTGNDKPGNFDLEEEQLAQKLYNELMIRYIVGYSSFVDPELYRTGMSRLLQYPEFYDPASFSNSLALFENAHNIRLLVKECCRVNHLRYWIGDDLTNYSPESPNCSIIAIPYYINQTVAGVIGVLGPTRIPYKELFATLKNFSTVVSDTLTRNLYKFKISVRQPQTAMNTESLLKYDYRLLLTTNKKVDEPKGKR